MLHGGWIDLNGSEDIGEFIENIVITSPEPDAEEWAVHDHEYCGSLGEYAGAATLQGIIDAYELCNAEQIDWERFIGYCEHTGDDPEPDNVKRYQERYAGEARNLVAWCEQFLDETGQLESIPENLRFYFNYQAFARDMEINDVFTVDHGGDVLVFWNH